MGQMIAGVTHELVNPAASLRQSLSPVKSHLDQVLLTLNHLFDNSEPEAITVKKGLEKELAAVVQAVSYSDQISERILEYSTALRNHARYDDEEAVSFDLQAAIEESNLLLRDRLKDVEFSVHFETAVELKVGSADGPGLYKPLYQRFGRLCFAWRSGSTSDLLPACNSRR